MSYLQKMTARLLLVGLTVIVPLSLVACGKREEQQVSGKERPQSHNSQEESPPQRGELSPTKPESNPSTAEYKPPEGLGAPEGLTGGGVRGKKTE